MIDESHREESSVGDSVHHCSVTHACAGWPCLVQATISLAGSSNREWLAAVIARTLMSGLSMEPYAGTTSLQRWPRAFKERCLFSLHCREGRCLAHRVQMRQVSFSSQCSPPTSATSSKQLRLQTLQRGSNTAASNIHIVLPHIATFRLV